MTGIIDGDDYHDVQDDQDNDDHDDHVVHSAVDSVTVSLLYWFFSSQNPI